MKLDFREIYDSGRDGEATPQLNQHSRNGKLPEAFQLRGHFAWIDKRQRNFSGTLCFRNTGTRPILVQPFVTIRQVKDPSWSVRLVRKLSVSAEWCDSNDLRRFLFSTHLLFAACFRSWNTFPLPFSFTAFSVTRTWASWLSFFF